MVGARFVREIENGEIVVITESGLESFADLFQRKIYGHVSSNISTLLGPIAL